MNLAILSNTILSFLNLRNLSVTLIKISTIYEGLLIPTYWYNLVRKTFKNTGLWLFSMEIWWGMTTQLTLLSIFFSDMENINLLLVRLYQLMQRWVINNGDGTPSWLVNCSVNWILSGRTPYTKICICSTERGTILWPQKLWTGLRIPPEFTTSVEDGCRLCSDSRWLFQAVCVFLNNNNY